MARTPLVFPMTFDSMRHIRGKAPAILLGGHLEDRAAEKFIRKDLAGFANRSFPATTLLGAARKALDG